VTEIVSAKNGERTIKKDGMFLLSRYDPGKEIERFLGGIRPGAAYVLFGNAAGHLTSALVSHGSPPNDILVCEPDETLYNFEQSNSRLGELFHGTVPHEKLKSWMERSLAAGKRPELVALPSFVKAYPHSFAHLERSFLECLAVSVENLKVEAYFSKLWLINYLRNLSSCLSGEGRRYIAYPENGKPGIVPVIVASGPSLDNWLPELKQRRKNVFIISVLSAGRTLLSAGIEPDILLISDAGAANRIHFDGIPPHIPVFASVYANSALLSAISNPVTYYDLEAETDAPTFRTQSPSVTIDAGNLALRLFARKPVFCGFDLCYSKHKGSHSRHNALSELRRVKDTGRMRSYESFATSYYRRKDLLIEAGVETNRHLMMLSSYADEVFNGCGFLPGGVEFPAMIKIDALPESDTIGERYSVPSVFASLLRDKISARLGKTLDILKDSVAPEMNRMFLREKLAGIDIHAISDYYLLKIKSLIGE